jgi:hypothetical protein
VQADGEGVGAAVADRLDDRGLVAKVAASAAVSGTETP